MSVKAIRKNDTVIAISGTSAGKSGKVLHVDKVRGRVLVEGLNLVKKTLRKTEDSPQGGIVEKEAGIAASNLMLYCPECKRGVRVRRRKDGDRRIRACAAAGCSHVFEV